MTPSYREREKHAEDPDMALRTNLKLVVGDAEPESYDLAELEQVSALIAGQRASARITELSATNAGLAHQFSLASDSKAEALGHRGASDPTQPGIWQEAPFSAV